MAKQLFLEGVDDLEGLSGVPLACKKVGRGEFKCTTIGRGMRAVGKGTIVTKLVTEGKRAAGRRLSGTTQAKTQKDKFTAAAKSCKGQGSNFRSCMSNELTTAGSRNEGRRNFISSGKKSAGESAGYWSASRGSMGKRSKLALAAKACKGKKGQAYKDCVKSKVGK